jgi:CBS domain-containing membrane protein
MTESALRVRDVMTPDVVTIRRNDKLLVADDVMRLGRIRHLPVLDEDDHLVGIVSQRDLFHSGLLKALGYGAHAQHKNLDMVVVKEAMKSEVTTISPDAPLKDAAKIMLNAKIGCLVVVEGGRLVGLLTEADFVKLSASD